MSDKFEHKIQQLLGNIELEPTEAVWQHVRHEIAPAKRKRYLMFWWLLPFLLIGGGALYLITNNNNRQPQQNGIQHPGNKTASATSDNKRISTGVGSKQLHPDATMVADHKTASSVIIKTAGVSSIQPGKRNHTKSNPYVTEITPITKPGKKEPGIPDETTVATLHVTDTINKKEVTTSTDITRTKNNTKPTDSALTTSPVPVTPRMNKQDKHHWQWGIITEAGFSTGTGNAFASGLMNASLASGSPVSGSSAVYNFEKKQNLANALMAIGVTAKRSVSGKTDVNVSLTYLYQSFGVRTTRYKDSLGGYPVYNASSVSGLHFINVAAGVNWYPARYGQHRFGAGITLDNMYLLKATNTFITQITYANVSSGFVKDHSLSGYNKWQPHLDISLNAMFATTSKAVVQLSPFVRYSLRELNNTGQDRTHLLGFGLNARYYFK